MLGDWIEMAYLFINILQHAFDCSRVVRTFEYVSQRKDPIHNIVGTGRAPRHIPSGAHRVCVCVWCSWQTERILCISRAPEHLSLFGGGEIENFHCVPNIFLVQQEIRCAYVVELFDSGRRQRHINIIIDNKEKPGDETRAHRTWRYPHPIRAFTT